MCSRCVRACADIQGTFALTVEGRGFDSRVVPGPSDFLGWVLLIPEDMTGPEVEIGWRLTRSARGQGIATEAARAVAEHGLKVFGLSHIIARIDPGNIASVKVAERIGMRLSAAGPKENLYHLTRADLAPPRMS